MRTVRELLQAFYREQNFHDDATQVSWIHVHLGPIRFPFPNPPQRRESIRLHDLTHILLGYDTSWTGEGEIAAWELASGFSRRYWIGYFYAPLTFSVGLMIAPLKTVRAFRQGWGQKNVYLLPHSASEIEEMQVVDLQRLLARDNAAASSLSKCCFRRLGFFALGKIA